MSGLIIPTSALKRGAKALGAAGATARQKNGHARMVIAWDGACLRLTAGSETVRVDVVTPVSGSAPVFERVVDLRTTLGFFESLDTPSVQMDAVVNTTPHLVVRSARSVGKFLTSPIDTYGCMTVPVVEERQALDPAVVRMVLDHTRHAIGSDPARYVIHGIHLDAAGVGVATDGKRMATQAADIPAALRGVTLPAEGIPALEQWMALAPTTVPLLVAQAMARVTFTRKSDEQRDILTIGILDGKFPDFRKVMPPESAVGWRVKRLDLAACLSRAAVVGSESVRLTPATDGVEVSSANPECGEFMEVLPCESRGSPPSMILNCRYVAQAVKALALEDVLDIVVTESRAPMLVRASTHSLNQQIVMPMMG